MGRVALILLMTGTTLDIFALASFLYILVRLPKKIWGKFVILERNTRIVMILSIISMMVGCMLLAVSFFINNL